MNNPKPCPNNSPTCTCNQKADITVQNNSKAKLTLKAVGSTILSFLIAFFPKCPLCWAAYLSMFGSFGVSNLPYMGWLYPVLIGFLLLHLYLVFKKRKVKGYGPFVLSIMGAMVLLGSRLLRWEDRNLLLTGMILILAGSLWNSFTWRPFQMSATT